MSRVLSIKEDGELIMNKNERILQTENHGRACCIYVDWDETCKSIEIELFKYKSGGRESLEVYLYENETRKLYNFLKDKYEKKNG